MNKKIKKIAKMVLGPILPVPMTLSRVRKKLKELPINTPGLTRDEHRQINEYYLKFGVEVPHEFHEFYKRTTGKFDPKFIPETFYYKTIDRYFNNWDMAKYLDNKTFYQWLFPGAPQPEILAMRQNGYWFDGNNQPITEHQALFIMKNAGIFFAKIAQESLGGHGVAYFDHQDPSEFIHHTNKDIVVQSPIEQSPVTAAINPSSVNTIRILTLLKKDGTPIVLSTVLRMGQGGAKVDNESSGGLSVGIQNDGRLNEVGYSINGESFPTHPTTGIRFRDIVIPNIMDCHELVKKLAILKPHFRLISWDIALDKDNSPILIEANLCDGTLNFHQLNNGPLFKEETENIICEAIGLPFTHSEYTDNKAINLDNRGGVINFTNYAILINNAA